MGLSGITIRSNLLSLVSKEQQLRIRQLSTFSTNLIRVPGERVIEMPPAQGHVSEQDQSPEGSRTHDPDDQTHDPDDQTHDPDDQTHDSDSDGQTSEEAELAKWKSIEVFKVGTCTFSIH